MLGYDWPRLHAALNDLPAALLLVAVIFDVLAAITKRPALRSAGYWTMIAGAVGGVLAVLSGFRPRSISPMARRSTSRWRTREPGARDPRDLRGGGPLADLQRKQDGEW